MKIPFDRRKFTSVQDLNLQVEDAIRRQTSLDSAGSVLMRSNPIVGDAEVLNVARLTLPDLTTVSGASFVKQPAPPVSLPRPFYALVASPPSAPGKERMFSFYPAVFCALGCLVLGALGGFFLLTAWQKPVYADLPGTLRAAPELLTPTEENEIDAAYDARRSDHLAEAEQLFTALAHNHPAWKTMEVEIGRTLFYDNDLDSARRKLRAAAGRGAAPAEANFLLGLLSSKVRDYRAAEASFAVAVALDPTQPNYYYFWGECLRNEGKPAKAAVKFRSAMIRNQYETSAGLYRLKYWLCSIEADRLREDGLGETIDAALAQTRPPMEALFAAGARAIQAGDFHAAASRLHRAREITDPTIYTVIMRDPFFSAERSRPELAELFAAETAAPAGQTGSAAGVR